MNDDQQNYWQPQDEAEAPQNPPAPEQRTPAVASPDERQEPTVSPGQQPEPAPGPAPLPRQRTAPEEVSWEASEIMEHARGPVWFIGFGVIVLLVIGALVFFREWIFAALVLVMAVAVVVMARRPAKVVRYTLSPVGLQIDDRLRYYSEFRAFGVIRDGAFFAIKLIPVRRFSPEVMVYFSERDGEQIVDILGSYLPMEEMKLDLADKIIRKIRL